MWKNIAVTYINSCHVALINVFLYLSILIWYCSTIYSTQFVRTLKYCRIGLLFFSKLAKSKEIFWHVLHKPLPPSLAPKQRSSNLVDFFFRLSLSLSREADLVHENSSLCSSSEKAEPPTGIYFFYYFEKSDLLLFGPRF